MIEATSCGGVVIFRGKILVLYKNYKNKYEGWVLPKGTVEAGEDYKTTALREVKEEAGVSASIIKYVGKSQYSFNTPQDMVEKDVHWYLMMADSYYSKPQRRSISSTPDTTNFTRPTICSSFPTRSRFWRRPTTSTWI